MTGGLGTIVIGGGTGFIGSSIKNAFESIGSKVLVVSRMPGVGNITWYDLQDQGLPKDTKAVINVCGQNVMDPKRRWSSGFIQNVHSSRINTTAKISDAIKKSEINPDVFVQISGVGYYPPSTTKAYDEYSEGGDKSDYFSNLSKEWEDAGKLPEDVKTRRVIIRSGVVLGRGGGMLKQIYPPFWFGLGGILASGKQLMPWIHLHDLVTMFMFAVEEEVSGVLNGVSPQIITNYEFTKAFGRAIWKPTVIPMPEGILNLAFGKERAAMMTKGQHVIPKRVQELGFKYAFSDIHLALKHLANFL